MKVTKLNSDKLITWNIKKHLINWEEDGNSSLEIRFRKLIYPYWKYSIVLFQPTIPGCRLKIDFLNVNKKLAVETDGSQHNEFNAFFYNNSKNVYKDAMKRDLQKSKWCENNQITLLTLIEEDLKLFSPKYILDKFGIEI